MRYYYSKSINLSFSDTRQYIEGKLKAEGFGIVSEIDMHTKFNEKLGIDFRPYKILGVCSPKHAYQAVLAEKNIGLMLPCNVVIQGINSKETEISIIDPIASMQAVQNPKLEGLAKEIQGKIKHLMEVL